MKFKFIDTLVKYDGRQLSSHFAYRSFGLSGDSIVAFVGPVDVKLTEMVDIEDVLALEPITSDSMLNFIVEVFEQDLKATIWMQRLLVATIQDELNTLLNDAYVERRGDDLYYDDRKMSVSIATVSPISALVHVGVNVSGQGAPIPISSLQELNIEARELGESILKRFADEFDDVQFARVKVNWVR